MISSRRCSRCWIRALHSWGVPHIFAKLEEDGFYGLGYAEAEDQLVGVVSMVFAIEGRAEPVFGDGELPWGVPVRLIESQSQMWHHVEESKAAYTRLKPVLRRQQEAYVAGFKAYMAEHPEPWHMLAIPRATVWFFNINDAMNDCAKAGVKLAGIPAAHHTHTRNK